MAHTLQWERVPVNTQTINHWTHPGEEEHEEFEDSHVTLQESGSFRESSEKTWQRVPEETESREGAFVELGA